MSQTLLQDFKTVKVVCVPIPKSKTKFGLSEKHAKKRLEKSSWEVWRGGSIGLQRRYDSYPNVKKKYEKLSQLLDKHHPEFHEYLMLLCAVHHGMPDFLCYRNGVFKFVECKVGYESLSKRQKVCINKLLQLGFAVEVHKIVEKQTKTRVADLNVVTGMKTIKDVQKGLKGY
ncbi:MAG TPA: VRR-NUC domain-containing protein [Candidatus Nanoarchaeia archaeon]|nr:VRR-NUC domain-containing protein [Candidatus Nanoarchaeia archaeon]